MQKQDNQILKKNSALKSIFFLNLSLHSKLEIIHKNKQLKHVQSNEEPSALLRLKQLYRENYTCEKIGKKFS